MCSICIYILYILCFLDPNEEIVFCIELETVLSGHDGWVYSIDWLIHDGKTQLLSASMDKSIIVWEQDVESGLWLEKVINFSVKMLLTQCVIHIIV